MIHRESKFLRMFISVYLTTDNMFPDKILLATLSAPRITGGCLICIIGNAKLLPGASMTELSPDLNSSPQHHSFLT